MNNPLMASSRLTGPYLNEEGAFLGLGTPLLEADADAAGRRRWRPRSRPVLETVLGAGYGLPVDLESRMGALRVVADALSKGERPRAAIALLHARLPPLPDLGAARRMAEADPLAKYSPLQPRVPKGEHGGGQWTTGESAAADSPVTPAQATIVEPFEVIRPVPLPYPTEITPFPIAPDIPDSAQRNRPLVNPYPRRRKCVEEWEAAYTFCDEQLKQRAFKPGYRGFGRNYERCVLGQVSEECGGNPVA